MPTIQQLNLCLSKGGKRMDRDQLAKIKTPKADGIWHPIGYLDFVMAVQKGLETAGFKVTGEAHGVSKGLHGPMDRYFGMFQVQNKARGGDYGHILGLRSSHDKTLSAGIAAGTRVFVCDNLAFSGEVRVFRRHTVNIEENLPGIISRITARLSARWKQLDQRMASYQKTELTEAMVHDTLIKAMDVKAVPVTYLPEVLKEWRTPKHPEFAKDKTAWRLFNAFTESLKGLNPLYLADRTEPLHGLFDGICGVSIEPDQKELALQA